MAKRLGERLCQISQLFYIGCLIFAAIYIQLGWINPSPVGGDFKNQMKIFSASMSITLAFLALLCKDIGRLDPSASHTITSLMIQYLIQKICSKLGKRYYNNIVKISKNVAKQQEEYLLKLLKSNAETEYGKAHKFREMTSVEDFRSMHPVITYSYLEPYINKVCNVNKNVFTKSDAMFMARSSGTTGAYKKFPLSGISYGEFMKSGPFFMYGAETKGIELNLQKAFILSYKPKVENTKTGLKIAPFSHFVLRHLPYYVLPKATLELTTEESAFYVDGLFALAERDIGSLMIGFAFQCYAFFQYMERKWDDLCNDIEHGAISANLEVEDELLTQLRNIMKPDKDRADELRREFKKGTQGLAKRLWPGLQYCRTVATGSVEIYVQALQDEWLKGVIFVPGMYGASEGFYGFNTSNKLNDPSYTLSLQTGFFEFLPENRADETGDTLLAHELQEGEFYELMITNSSGLCRYRTGDVLLVTSHLNQCPIFEFQYRKGQILNLVGDRLTEHVLYKAVSKASEKLGGRVLDYTACEDVYLHGIKAVKSGTRFYTLFVEMDHKLSPKNLGEFDKAVCAASEPYNRARSSTKSISPMEVIQVKVGTFLKLKEIMNREVQNMQFKIPRALRVKEHLDFLMSQQIE